MKKFHAQPLVFFAIILTVLLVLPALAAYDPMRMGSAPYLPPTTAHLAGTDSFGRDVLSRVLVGMQQTALMGLAAVATAVIIGGALSGIAQFKRAAVMIGAVVMTGLSIPPLILVLALITWLGQSPVAAAIAVGIAYSFGVARLLIDAAAVERSEAHVEAAYALGASLWRVQTRHVLPGLMGLLASYAVLVFAYSVTQLAGLSFLGVTGAPGAPELGLMMAESRYTIRDAPWAGIAPALAVIALIVTANRLSDRISHR